MTKRSAFAGPGIMLLSAAIFGYFGFSTGFNPRGTSGQLLVYVPILEWTLKGSAVLFLLSAGLAWVAPRPGHLLYAVVGLVGAVLLLLVAALDFLDPVHTVFSPVLLVIFALWNGFGSLSGLGEVLGRRSGTENS